MLKWMFTFSHALSRTIATAGMVVAILCSPAAADETMRMTFIPPFAPVQALGGPAYWMIYLDGPIDSLTAQRFEAEVQKRGADGAQVHLNSPGGDLLGGIELGQVMQRHGMTTYVAKAPIDPAGAGYGKDLPGVCASACVFAFLGGDYRYLKDGSQLGVHRFSRADPSAAVPGDLDRAQLASAAIVAFLDKMKVDPALLTLMATTAPDQISWLTQAQAVQWNVVNNGRLLPTWTIETVSGSRATLYLKGEQISWVGLGKANFVCGKDGITFFPMYQAGDNADHIAEIATNYFVMLGDKFIPIGTGAHRLTAHKGYVSAPFLLPEQLARALSHARAIGFAVQSKDVNDIFYWGFQVDVRTPDQSSKIEGFVQNCLEQNSR